MIMKYFSIIFQVKHCWVGDIVAEFMIDIDELITERRCKYKKNLSILNGSRNLAIKKYNSKDSD